MLVIEVVGLIAKWIGQFTVEIQVVHVHGKTDLPQVTQTCNALAFGFGPRERRQQHRGQDGDDGDDDQQFN